MEPEAAETWDPLLYLPPERLPDAPGRALAKAGLRALSCTLLPGLALALLSPPAGLTLLCATWVLFPLAVARDRIPPRALLALGALLGATQTVGAWLQWVYLAAVFAGTGQPQAAEEVYRVLLQEVRAASERPGGYAFLIAGALLWGVALGVSHAALSEPAPHLRRSRRALSQIAYGILQVPALFLLPTLGLLAGAASLAAEGKLDTAFFVGTGVALLGAGFLLLATTMVSFALQLSARGLELRLLGPDPTPRRPPRLPLNRTDPSPEAGQPRPTRREES